MIDREKVITEIVERIEATLAVDSEYVTIPLDLLQYALSMLKEQEKKRIALHKKHAITWKRNDEFSMRNLYETICETLLDEGELFIARTDDHEKVDFVFYVAEGR